MSDALDDWELAAEEDIKAPVVLSKPLKKMTISTSSSSSPTTTRSASPNTSVSSSPIIKGNPPTILRRTSDRSGKDNLGVEDSIPKNDNRSQHEKNRELWNKANSYEQPIISRNDSNSIRTEYVPEIKILRRPKSPTQEEVVRATQAKSKSLAQREADYNAAREKIFGSPSTSSPSTTNNITANNNNNNNNDNNNSNNNGTNSTLSRPISRSSSNSRSGSPSLSNQNIKPIEFKGSSPSVRLVQRQYSSPTVTNDAIRQPQGPTMNPQAANVQPQGSRQDKQEGSIGFRRPLKRTNTPSSVTFN